jgi:hypothetical protein
VTFDVFLRLTLAFAMFLAVIVGAPHFVVLIVIAFTLPFGID